MTVRDAAEDQAGARRAGVSQLARPARRGVNCRHLRRELRLSVLSQRQDARSNTTVRARRFGVTVLLASVQASE